MKKIISISILLFSFTVYGGFLEDIKLKIRPYAIQYLGQETTVKFLGEDPNKITLPAIPEVSKNATSAENLDVVDINENKIPKEKREKLNYIFVKEVVEATRKTSADNNEVVKWLSVLNQGGTYEGVYRALVLDNSYRGLENYENEITEPVIKFTIDYYDKFLDLAVQKDNLIQVNFFLLKRETVEKSLEILDVYIAKDKSDLYRWYAVFSEELARDYAPVWKKKFRKNKSAQYHYRWASQVPLQILKGEVLVKIHKVFNYLMP